VTASFCRSGQAGKHCVSIKYAGSIPQIQVLCAAHAPCPASIASSSRGWNRTP
jgi:hypothetical protein